MIELRDRLGLAIESRPQSSHGGWIFDSTTLRFSREIATTAPDRPMPLVLRLNENGRPRAAVFFFS